MLPSCRHCQYAVKESTFGEPIHCTRHHFKVRTPLHAFCTELSNNETPGLRRFIQKHQFNPSMMYQWIEVYHHGYYHEPVAVATLQEFATWTLEKQLQNIQSLNRQKNDELEQRDAEQGRRQEEEPE